jgi:CheY-like chemotaxis protein
MEKQLSLPPSPRPETHADLVPRVLIVDDNKDMADSMVELVSLFDCEAQAYYDGQSALAALATYTPTALLLDLALPNMNGFELLHAIRQYPRLENVYAVAISGYAQASDRNKSLSQGFNEHMAKPVDIPQLEKLLKLHKYLNASS